MPIKFVEDLQNRLNDYQERVSKDNIQCLFVEDKVENLLAEAKRYKVYFTALKVDKVVISELNKVINQIDDFLAFVQDCLAASKRSCL